MIHLKSVSFTESARSTQDQEDQYTSNAKRICICQEDAEVNEAEGTSVLMHH